MGAPFVFAQFSLFFSRVHSKRNMKEWREKKSAVSALGEAAFGVIYVVFSFFLKRKWEIAVPREKEISCVRAYLGCSRRFKHCCVWKGRGKSNFDERDGEGFLYFVWTAQFPILFTFQKVEKKQEIKCLIVLLEWVWDPKSQVFLFLTAGQFRTPPISPIRNTVEWRARFFSNKKSFFFWNWIFVGNGTTHWSTLRSFSSCVFFRW